MTPSPKIIMDTESATCSPSLRWGRTLPTQNGYFWYREHVQHRAVIYDVSATARFGFVQKWDGTTKDIKEMHGWWAGPILKPDSPPLPSLENVQSSNGEKESRP